MSQKLVHTTVAEVLRKVASSHVGWPRTSSSGQSDALFWTLQAPEYLGTYRDACIHTYTELKLNLLKEILVENS